MSHDAANDTKPLAGWTRVPCPSCNRSYKFYCPECCITIGKPEDVAVPSLTLPLQVHIWFQDKKKKSTAPHAKVLAPQSVDIIQYPLDKEGETLAVYTREDTVVVYPTYESETLADLTPEDLQQVKTLVFIDCPWQKAPAILHDPALVNLRCVKLAKPPLESKFWRYHKAGKGCVSTIEAIQLMLEEYVDVMVNAKGTLREGSENTKMSDLLFFFELLYCQISERFEVDPGRKKRPPMDEEEKERQRLMRTQKEAGKKRKKENKHEAWTKMVHALETGEITEKPRGRCFNCKSPDHEARNCPNPCRYCKDPEHWSGICPNKHLRHQAELKQQIPITKAI
uniref:tRNA-uridine aminocarboxypropyltransferase 1 n=1 Tax=Globisporangium ultimum (strain ATCC 200006 / CBS 805.95 / DAOM BR144) TaxID=431595 RepID=K3WYM5_GLOUD